MKEKTKKSTSSLLITIQPKKDALKIKRLTGGLPWWLSGKESTCQCRRHRFDPGSEKIPHAMERLS